MGGILEKIWGYVSNLGAWQNAMWTNASFECILFLLKHVWQRPAGLWKQLNRRLAMLECLTNLQALHPNKWMQSAQWTRRMTCCMCGWAGRLAHALFGCLAAA